MSRGQAAIASIYEERLGPALQAVRRYEPEAADRLEQALRAKEPDPILVLCRMLEARALLRGRMLRARSKEERRVLLANLDLFGAFWAVS